MIDGQTRKNGDDKDEGGSGAKSLEGEQTVMDTPIYCPQSTTTKRGTRDTKNSQQIDAPMTGVVHLDWDQGEPPYLYNAGTLVCQKREIHAGASRKFQIFLEHRKGI